MKIIYPVLFYQEKNGKYSVFIPDFNNCSTCGDTLIDAMENAEELIASMTIDYLEEGKKLPKSSTIENISFKKLEQFLSIPNWNYKSKFKTYITIDIDHYLAKWGKKLIKKTVNIPIWLNTKAEDLKINFSKTLEEALMEKIYK